MNAWPDCDIEKFSEQTRAPLRHDCTINNHCYLCYLYKFCVTINTILLTPTLTQNRQFWQSWRLSWRSTGELSPQPSSPRRELTTLTRLSRSGRLTTWWPSSMPLGPMLATQAASSWGWDGGAAGRQEEEPGQKIKRYKKQRPRRWPPWTWPSSTRPSRSWRLEETEDRPHQTLRTMRRLAGNIWLAHYIYLLFSKYFKSFRRFNSCYVYSIELISYVIFVTSYKWKSDLITWHDKVEPTLNFKYFSKVCLVMIADITCQNNLNDVNDRIAKCLKD